VNRVVFLFLVLGAVVVGNLWAANYDMGFLLLNKEYEQKILLRLGGVVGEAITEPGFRVKIPLLDEVVTFDRRLQYLNAEPVELQIGQGEQIIVDYFVIWRIVDPVDFLASFPRGMQKARDRIRAAVHATVNARVGELTMTQLLARAPVLDLLAAESTAKLGGTGVTIVDVRISRTELPRKAEESTYSQMREQQNAIARDYRVQGQSEARRMRAEAERDAETGLAEARRDSEVLRGEGDAAAARIYADAYGRDPEFYSFVRTLEAYRKTIGEGTTLIVPPDHPFFRFLDPRPGRSAR
jgi:membrane protease subunit HflC